MSNYEKMATVFDEWNHQYSKNPSSFECTLNEDGSPKFGYGEQAAKFFMKVAKEINIDFNF